MSVDRRHHRIDYGGNMPDAALDDDANEVSVADEVRAHRMGKGDHRVVFVPNTREEEEDEEKEGENGRR